MPPLQYEHIRDAYIKKGVSEKKAKSIAAATYNKAHPGHPMKPGTHGHMASGGSVKKKRSAGPSLPPQLAAAAAGAPPPSGAPMAGGNAPPGLPGMKRGGRAHGGVAKYGETTHSRGGGVARRGFAGGGVTRGDGVAQRGHTRGTCR